MKEKEKNRVDPRKRNRGERERRKLRMLPRFVWDILSEKSSTRLIIVKWVFRRRKTYSCQLNLTISTQRLNIDAKCAWRVINLSYSTAYDLMYRKSITRQRVLFPCEKFGRYILIWSFKFTSAEFEIEMFVSFIGIYLFRCQGYYWIAMVIMVLILRW